MTRRLVLSFLALTAIILASLEIPLALNYRDRLRNDLSGDLVRDAFAIGGFAEETLEGSERTDLAALASTYAGRTGARVVIVDAGGHVVADSRPGAENDFSTRPEIDTALHGEVATGTRHSDTLKTDLLYVAVPIASGGQVRGAVRITYGTDDLDARMRDYLVSLAAIAAVSMAAAAGLGIVFARWVHRPLGRLEATASRLGDGDLTARAETDAGPPEMRQLARTFNTMASQLDELIQAQEAFVSDASHQLRTPLAALRLQMENLQSDLADADDFEHSNRERRQAARSAAKVDVDAALVETARLSRLVDGLLALARADRARSGDVTAIELAPLLDERRYAWEAFAADRGIAVRADETAGRALANEDRVSQALDNLIANAIDATGDGGTIVLRAAPARSDHRTTSNGSIEVHISDDGPGMTADERQHAFDRFWSGRKGSTALGGSGLGLAIARKLVRVDQGDLELRESESGGVDAVIRLPTP